MSQIKTNTTALQDILNAASNLPKPIDTSDATATSSKILSGYTAYVDDKMIAGNIPNKTGNDVSVNGNTVNIPAGNYENDVLKSVGVVTQATPSISIDSAGKITATSTQTEGYVSAGTKSGTKQLTTQAAQTITPGTSDKTAVSSGVYTTGATIVKGDANLKAENILSGKSIFGVSGGIPNNGSVSQTMDGINTKSVSIPAGYTSGGTVGLDNSIDSAVSAAIAALTEKGVEVPDGTKVDGLAALITAIESGGNIEGHSILSGSITLAESATSDIKIYHDNVKYPSDSIMLLFEDIRNGGFHDNSTAAHIASSITIGNASHSVIQYGSTGAMGYGSVFSMYTNCFYIGDDLYRKLMPGIVYIWVRFTI